MKSYALQIIQQLKSARSFFIVPLCFLLFTTVCYILFACFDIYSNVTEKILYELLIFVWLLSPLLLFNNIFIRLFSVLIILVVIVAHMLSVITALLYNICAAETFWEVLAASSWPEIKEFLMTMSSWTVFGALASLIILPLAFGIILFLSLSKQIEMPKIKFRLPAFLRSATIPLNFPFLISFLPFTIILFVYICSSKPQKILKKNLLLRYCYEFVVFKERMGSLANMKNLPVPYRNVKFNQNTSDLLGVVVIGESASRKHLGCYGYERNTTPYFSSIKDELLLFDNILSSSPVTPDALKYLLTNACLGSKQFAPTSTILQILSYLKAESYYISNQGRWNQYNMPCTLIFNQADEIKTLCSTVAGKEYFQYDEIILPEFISYLNRPSKQRPRIIFLHLMGSHRVFEKRVPENEVLFSADYIDNLSHDKSLKTINNELNAYDSSIAYTDKILKMLITELKKKTSNPAFLLYFSDHGEVLNANNRDKRSYKCIRREAYEIPFIVWTNMQYRKRYPDITKYGISNLHKLAQTDRLFPSLCALMQISWNDFPHEYNIFSDKFSAVKKVYSQQGASTKFRDKDGSTFIFHENNNQ